MTELIEDKEQRKQALLQKIVKDIERFLKKHSKKVFYAFAFDCSKDVGEILWAFNTEKALASAIKELKKSDEDNDYNYGDKNSEDYLSLRYGIGDWKHATESKAYYIFGDGDACHAMYDKAEELDEENGVEHFEQEIMDFFEELLLAFCQTPTWQAIPKTADFKILLSEHNDNEIDDTLPRSERFMQRLNALIDAPLDWQFPKIPEEARTILSELDRQLFEAVRHGDGKEVQRLLASGANVNAVEQGEFKATLRPLHIAVDKNNLECAGILVENGADVNVKNSRLSSASYPLYTAVYRSLEMTRFLLNNGADVNKAKALFAALNNRDEEIFKMLLQEYGADPNIRQVSDTLLAATLKRCPKNYALIKMLLDCGANPNLTSSIKGWSFGIPIIIAARYGVVKAVQLLIDAGAEVNVRGVDGSPLMGLMDGSLYGESCDSSNRLAIARMLINAGADVNAKDKKGKTVLDHVPESSRLMRQLLEENGAKKSSA